MFNVFNVIILFFAASYWLFLQEIEDNIEHEISSERKNQLQI